MEEDENKEAPIKKNFSIIDTLSINSKSITLSNNSKKTPENKQVKKVAKQIPTKKNNLNIVPTVKETEEKQKLRGNKFTFQAHKSSISSFKSQFESF
jgi:hypothetical protein